MEPDLYEVIKPFVVPRKRIAAPRKKRTVYYQQGQPVPVGERVELTSDQVKALGDCVRKVGAPVESPKKEKGKP